MNKDEMLKLLIQMIEEISIKKSWGEIKIIYQSGVVKLIEKNNVIKIN